MHYNNPRHNLMLFAGSALFTTAVNFIYSIKQRTESDNRRALLQFAAKPNDHLLSSSPTITTKKSLRPS